MEAHICSKRGKDIFLQHGARIWRSLWFVKLSVGTWKLGEDLQMQFAMSIAASNIAAVYNNARGFGSCFLSILRHGLELGGGKDLRQSSGIFNK